jgi:uncharacterized protein (UPF0332 family)
MFHAARALIYSRKLREQGHSCLIEAVRVLFVETRKIPVSLLEGFKEAKSLREDADYYGRWSRAGCEKLLETADRFLKSAAEIVALTEG